MKALVRTAPVFGWFVLLAGVLFQAVIRDRFESVSVFFYALPKPCLALGAFILLVWPNVSNKSRLCAACAAVLISVWWVSVSWGGGTGTEPAAPAARMADERPGEVKVLFWNLNRPAGLHQGMVDLVKEFHPHVAAFVEPGPRAGQLCEEYERLLPGYKAAFMPRGILWLSRVPSKYRDRGKLDQIGAYARFDVHDLGPTFSMVVGDVYSQVFRSRSFQLGEILGHAQGRTDAIIAGDFNTPGESLFFENYRRAGFKDVFETAGHGLRETWPLGLPLLSLDHIWAGPDWQVVEARTLHRWSSDHKAVLATLWRK